MSYIDAVPPTDPPLLTAAEVATLFRVSPATVRTWRREGYISAVRTPGTRQLLFRRDEIELLMQAEATA